MTKKTKVLATSIASIAMCASIAVGGTFALFTSESEVNVAVTSGTVDVNAVIDNVKLYSAKAADAATGEFQDEYDNWYVHEQQADKFAVGGTATIANGVLTVKDMVPGDKITFDVTVTNESTVDALYRTTVACVSGDKLYQALNISVEASAIDYSQYEYYTTAWELLKGNTQLAEQTLTVTVEFPMTLGDTYQEESCQMSYTVEAVQGNANVERVEQFKFFPDEFDASDVENMEGIFNAPIGSTDVNVNIPANTKTTWTTGGGHGSTPFDETNTGLKTITIEGENQATSVFEATGAGVGPIGMANGGTLTMKNLTVVDSTVSYKEDAWEFTYLELTGNVVFENVTFTSGIQPSGNATFKNCTFITEEESVYAVWVENGSATFENCTFTGTRGLKAHEAYNSEVVSVSVNNCTFANISKKPGIAFGTFNAETTVSITNSTFYNCQAGDQGLYIYETDTDVTTFTFVSENNTVINPTVVEDPADLDAALSSAANGDTIQLGSGSYTIDTAKSKNLTIVGNGNTNIAIEVESSEGCDYGFEGSTVTFENVIINTNSTTYIGYARMKATFNNCTFNGTYTLYDNSEFNNCTFNVSGDVYNVWTWGAPNATFNGCTFNSDGKAVLLYGQANTVLTVNGCTFNDNGGVSDLKAAIEIGNDYNKSYTLIVNNTVVNGYEINDKGINTGTTLWANKNSMSQEVLNVVVDDVKVY